MQLNDQLIRRVDIPKTVLNNFKRNHSLHIEKVRNIFKIYKILLIDYVLIAKKILHWNLIVTAIMRICKWYFII